VPPDLAPVLDGTGGWRDGGVPTALPGARPGCATTIASASRFPAAERGGAPLWWQGGPVSDPPSLDPAARCAANPGRLALSGCTRCDPASRAPAAADRSCARALDAAAPERPRRSAGLPHRDLVTAGLTAGALLALPVVLLGGAVSSEYVGAHLYSLIVPALVGLACGWAVSRGAAAVAPRRSGPTGGLSAAAGLLAVGLAALSAALAFRFADTPYGGAGRWVPPVLLGAAGALAWSRLFEAPAPEAPGRGGDSRVGRGLRAWRSRSSRGRRRR